MSGRDRKLLAERALDGYPHGPNANQEAIEDAWSRLDGADAVIVVEGVSDQIAVETLAGRYERDLDGERIVVFPMGGAHQASVFLPEFGPRGRDLDVAGLLDADAVEAFCLAALQAGLGRPRSGDDLASIGLFACAPDLEYELIRAVGPDRVQEVISAQGEIRAFHTFQKQAGWASRPVEDQLHRFIRSKARRSLRYARLLVDATEHDRVPQPLQLLLSYL